MMQYLRDGAQILNCSWACYTKDGRPPFVLERALAVLTPKLLVVAAAGNHGQFWSKKKGEDGEKEDKKYREKNMLPARDAPAYPAALPNVVAVGASGPDGPATFNPIAWGTGAGGKERIAALAPWINVLAPGVAVRGPYFGDEREEEVRVPDKAPSAVREQKYRTKEFNGEAEWSGTSFAAATVTGAIAARIRHGMTAREALDELLGEGDPDIGRADT
jgi:subtilisin family serine protease